MKNKIKKIKLKNNAKNKLKNKIKIVKNKIKLNNKKYSRRALKIIYKPLKSKFIIIQVYFFRN